MDSRYRFLTLGIPWTQSMPSRDVNAATRLAEASWRRDKVQKMLLLYPTVRVSVCARVGVHMLNVTANVKVLKFQSFFVFSCIFSYLRQENSTGRGVPTFSVWYRACLSGTARGSLVQAVRHSLLFIYVSNYDVTTQSATIPATSEGSRDVKENPTGC